MRGNLLDIVLTNMENHINNIPVCEPPVATDHRMISFCLRFAVSKSSGHKCIVKFDYSKAEWDGLCDFLILVFAMRVVM